MRKTINHEQSGLIKPRAEHEGARDCYGAILSIFAQEGLTGEGKIFLTEEVCSLLKITKSGPIVHPNDTLHVLDNLIDDNLQHRFALRQLQDFVIYNDRLYAIAKELLHIYKDDPAFSGILKPQIDIWERGLYRGSGEC